MAIDGEAGGVYDGEKEEKEGIPMNDYREILKTMEAVVREAGAALMDRERSRRVHEKGYADFVTEVDLQVQTMVSQRLSSAFPEIQFMGEEQDNSDLDLSGACWILDPVDGTSNLIHDLKMSAISLGLAVNRETVAGVIYQPYLDEMFTAVKGGGAYLNGVPMHTSAPERLKDCIVGLGTAPYHHDLADKTFACAKEVFLHSMDIRRSGSAALDLAYVAAGRLDAMFELILQPWDFAAGRIIVEEAGGQMTHIDGEAVDVTVPGTILATNGKIHTELSALLCRTLL